MELRLSRLHSLHTLCVLVVLVNLEPLPYSGPSLLVTSKGASSRLLFSAAGGSWIEVGFHGVGHGLSWALPLALQSLNIKNSPTSLNKSQFCTPVSSVEWHPGLADSCCGPVSRWTLWQCPCPLHSEDCRATLSSVCILSRPRRSKHFQLETTVDYWLDLASDFSLFFHIYGFGQVS